MSHEDNFIDKVLTKIGLRNASKFLTLSAIVEKEVKAFAADKKIYRSELPVYDCYQSDNKFDIKIFKTQLGFNEESFVILFFGYIRKYKGLDVLINAFPSISEKIPDARLLIVGEFYDKENTYTEQIKKLNIEEKVKVVNQFVPNEDVAKYYQVSDLVVLPYRSATQSGILNVAYGFYKPVIVTNVGGLAEFVEEGKTGFVVKPESPDAITDAVLKFIKLKASVDFSINIEKFNQKNSFNKLPEIFTEIIDNK